MTTETPKPTAVLHTSMGDITVELWPDKAPKAAENFLKLAQSGYYSNVTFHRVIDGFMIQGGDPTGTGAGGESAFGGPFEDEFDRDARNWRGALSMANAGPNTNGSQFFIVQSRSCGAAPEEKDALMLRLYANERVCECKRELARMQLRHADRAELSRYVDEANAALSSLKEVPAERQADLSAAADRYLAEGGTPHLDFLHTVFGRVTDGMDIVDAIAASPTDRNDRPKTPVVIRSVEVRA